MIVAFITDFFDYNLPVNEINEARKKAYEELLLACQRVNAELHLVSMVGVDQGKTDMLDIVYNSDVLVVDMSIKTQQSLLNYHIGVREHLKRYDNIVLVLFSRGKVTEELNSVLGPRTKLFPYVITDAGVAVSLDDRYIQTSLGEYDNLRNQVFSRLPPMSENLERTFSELETRNRATLKERFIADIRRVREQYKGAELREVSSAA
ncbi:hypothetical protein FBUS_02170 [Fasciolopsis buskii]|uniref:Uncharacterized protein n=1 Tax=Fasciolopsis buskii TaxID=27845 RepID=A0A8E0SA69_9TREM|nr:hypothetical protein FBUS_02170 [Fasciolopsis buski]